MEDFIGAIKIFAGNYPPYGWAFCMGQQMNIQQYAALYSLIGTKYGGNGTTTFNLPNFQGMVPVGVNNTTGYLLGNTGGKETQVLTMANLPAHTHPVTGTVTLNANPDGADTPSPVGAAYTVQPGSGGYASTGTEPMKNMSIGNTAVGNMGGGMPYENRQPFIAMSYIICISDGIYPPRPD